MVKVKISERQLNLLREYSKKAGSFIFEGVEDDEDDFDPFGYGAEEDEEDPKMKGVTNSCILGFNKIGNAKLKHPYFSLPAGYSCPGAKNCITKADRTTGKLTDKPTTQFRCYAASQETRPNVRNARWKNFDLLREAKTKDAMYKLISDSINFHFETSLTLLRIHESGDFFNQAYFDAWLNIAKDRPETIFYAYTKAIPYWVARLNDIPKNFKLTASKGGHYDSLIEKYNLKHVEVVFTPEDAKAKRLYIDKDDSLAWKQDKSFAILLHGIQPANTPASDAMKNLRKRGLNNFGKN